MTFGKNMREVRKQQGLTQKQLGELLNISQSAIGQFERMQNNPKMDTVIKIADALNVPPAKLIDWSNVPFDSRFNSAEEEVAYHQKRESEILEKWMDAYKEGEADPEDLSIWLKYDYSGDDERILDERMERDFNQILKLLANVLGKSESDLYNEIEKTVTNMSWAEDMEWLENRFKEIVSLFMDGLTPEGKAEVAKYSKYIYNQPEYRKDPFDNDDNYLNSILYE